MSGVNPNEDFLKFEDNFADLLTFEDNNLLDATNKLDEKNANPFPVTKSSSDSLDFLEFNEQHFRSNNVIDIFENNSSNFSSALGFKTNVGKSRFYSEVETTDPLDVLPRHEIASGANPLAARESVIRSRMATRENEYTDLQSYRIFIGTWNVNGQVSSASLSEWLACDPSPPDIYAIGFQELDLSKEAFVFSDSPREEMWYKACKEGLHPKASYKCLRLVRLVGMMLIVFIKKELIPYVTNIYSETVGTGMLGRMVANNYLFG